MGLSDRTVIEKTLSANDVGLTGGHQYGVLIPKKPEILGLMPELDSETRNPRVTIVAFDAEGLVWRFNYIYYNNASFGGTRNEYRLTGIVPYLKSCGACEGDVLQLELRSDGAYRVGLVPSDSESADANESDDDGIVRLQLTDSWRLVKW